MLTTFSAVATHGETHGAHPIKYLSDAAKIQSICQVLQQNVNLAEVWYC